MTRRTSTKAPSRGTTTLGGGAVLLIIIVIILYNLFSSSTGDTPSTGNVPATGGSSSGGGQGGWWEVYFTEPKTLGDPNKLAGTIEERLINNIKNAKTSIHIAAFEFDLPLVADALIDAKKRNVDVKWITDDENGIQADAEDLKLFPKLQKTGIEIKDDKRSGLMHNKFWIFDKSYVWTGATNITVNGMFKNNNNVIVIRNADLVAVFEKQFNEMWGGEFGAKSPSAPDKQVVKIDNTSIQVLFSPEDKAMNYLIPLVKEAKKQIRFMAFSFTHDDLGQAVLDRAKAGVNVSGIFETRGSEDLSSELCPMYRAKIPVRQDTNSTSFHHKVIVIDENITVTGSLNFSENADSSNNENVMIIRGNPDIAAQFLKEFNTRWAESTDPKPADMKCK